jgi:hypothetical protein
LGCEYSRPAVAVARERLESREIRKTVPFHVLAYLHKEPMSRDKAVKRRCC